MLRDLEYEAAAAIVGLERREDRRKLAFEGDVDDGADNLRDAAGQVAVSYTHLTLPTKAGASA